MAATPPPLKRPKLSSLKFSVATDLHTMEPQEETGGLKRAYESSSDDDSSCYGTPTDSPRDDSLDMEQTNCKESSSVAADFTVVLTGTTGNGKSAVCNFFMQRNIFKVERSFLRVSRELESVVAIIEGKRIELVDTPGFFDASLIEGDSERLDFAKALINIRSGFHMLGVVFNISKRIEKSEDKLFEDLLCRYKHYLPYVVLIFTHGKHLGNTEDEQKKVVEDMIKELKEDKTSNLFQLLEKVNYRYIILESVKPMEEGYHASKCKKLVEMIDKIFRETGKPATNEFALSIAEQLKKVKVDQMTLEKELADRIKTAQEMMKKDKSKNESNSNFYEYLKYAIIIGGGVLAGLFGPSTGLIEQGISAAGGAVRAAAENCTFQ